MKEIADGHAKVEQAQNKFFALKTEIEESPLQTLRMEIGHKQLEITDLQSKCQNSMQLAEDYKVKFDLLKKDMVQLKRQIDQDKEAKLTQQAEELEQLKQMMRVKQAQDDERAQYDQLKQQLGHLKSNLTQQQQT